MIVYHVIRNVFNCGMEELKIRLENMRELLRAAKTAKATQRAVAERLGIDSSRLSQLCGPSPSRPIKEDTALEFEKRLKRPRRWLDEPRSFDELLAAWRGDPIDASTVERGTVVQHAGDHEPTRGPVLIRNGIACIEVDQREAERRYLPDRRNRSAIDITYFSVTGSMGNGHVAQAYEHAVGRMTVELPWLHKNISYTALDNLALIDGRGDSMAPTYNDGDVLLVDRGVTRADVDAVYVLLRGDELYIKRLQRLGDRKFMMISDNPVYRPVEIVLEDDGDFKVLARVRYAWKGQKL